MSVERRPGTRRRYRRGVARPNKTLMKASQLAGAPVEGYFMASRVHPLLAMIPTGFLMIAFLSGQFFLQILTTIVVIVGLFMTLGRSVAITADETLILQSRPPLWRPARVVERHPRMLVPVDSTRLYWKPEIDGDTYWVNKTFVDHVNLISDTPLDGATSKRPSGKSASASSNNPSGEGARERQIVDSSRRITPKGTRNRKPKKYR